MFAVLYIPTDSKAEIVKVNNKLSLIRSSWKVDTDPETGAVQQYEDLQEAKDRVDDIRSKGGDACLTVIID